MIRTVPDGNVGPDGTGAFGTEVPGSATASSSSPPDATRTPISTTRTRPSTPSPTNQPVLPPPDGGAGGGTAGSNVRGV